MKTIKHSLAKNISLFIIFLICAIVVVFYFSMKAASNTEQSSNSQSLDAPTNLTATSVNMLNK